MESFSEVELPMPALSVSEEFANATFLTRALTEINSLHHEENRREKIPPPRNLSFILPKKKPAPMLSRANLLLYNEPQSYGTDRNTFTPSPVILEKKNVSQNFDYIVKNLS